MRLFRNGVQAAESATYNGTLLAPPMASLGIGVKTDDCGSAPAAVPGYYYGKLDDLGIWGRALSPDEVFGIYQAGLSGQGLAQATAIRRIALAITKSGTQVTVRYEAGTLEWTSAVPGPWVPVSSARPPSFSTNASSAMKYFRVR